MKKSTFWGGLGLGLLSLLAPKEIEAGDTFKISGGVGTYILPDEITSINGFPYGLGLALEGRTGNLGFKAGFDMYEKQGNSRSVINSRGEEKEGEKETAEYARIYGGVTAGSENVRIGGGGVAVEVSDLFTTTERSGFWSGQEVRKFPSRGNLGGVYGELDVSGKLESARVYLNFVVDYLFNGVEEPVVGIKAGVGVKF
jgi:hypothetical protein